MAQPKNFKEHVDQGWAPVTIRRGETRSRQIDYSPATFNLVLSKARYAPGGDDLADGAEVPDVEIEENALGAVLVMAEPRDYDVVVPAKPVAEIRQ